MPETPERYYRAAAEAYALSEARLWGLDEPPDYDVRAAMLNEHLRAAVDAALTVERERIVTGLTAGDPVTADEVAKVVWGEGRG